jgi:phosphatidylserine decarboxylase
MEPILYLDRASGTKETEKVYKGGAIELLYGTGLLSKLIGTSLAHALARIPFFSAFYGYLQDRPASAKKVGPFIKEFNIDTSEFAQKADSYISFNDFFTRKLKPSARPIAPGQDVAVIPADGRYWFYPHFDAAEGIIVKGETFDLPTLLGDAELAERYRQGAMVIARLCPTDYHRYHFPVDCVPGDTQLINGWLYSVNPAAIKKDLRIFTQNKRTLCKLYTEKFGTVLFMDIGATCVGAMHQTYASESPCLKGDEKGYFSFGASSLILLFEPNIIQFDKDLVDATAQGVEIRCLMGQSMGKMKAKD